MKLVKKLHRIPHLRLPINFDALQMQAELVQVDSWTSHSHAAFRQMTEEEMRDFSRGYSGVSLYEFNGQADYATDNYEIFQKPMPGVTIDPVTQQIVFFPTSLVKKMPYTSAVIDQITDRKGRTRIMQSAASHSIVWHSHNRGPWFNSYMHEAIVHVPIRTNPHVLHSVRDYRHPDSAAARYGGSSHQELLEKPSIFTQSYKEGECWIFNSWHDHYYHNYSDQTRFTLILYLRWNGNEKLLRLVERAVEDYDGPLLPDDNAEPNNETSTSVSS